MLLLIMTLYALNPTDDVRGDNLKKPWKSANKSIIIL